MPECKYLKDGNCLLYDTKCGTMIITCLMKGGEYEKTLPK